MPDIDSKTGLIAHESRSFGASSEWLLERLREEGIRVHPNCELARGIRLLKEHLATMGERGMGTFASREAALDAISTTIGTDFTTKALHRAYLQGFRPPLRRWAHLTKCDPNVFRAGRRSVERDLVWELVLGSLASRFVPDVRFEEPDLVCTFEGRRFGIAAKCAYSISNLWENVEVGFKQAWNTECDVALVYVNVAGLLPIDELYRRSFNVGFVHNDDATDWAKAEASDWCNTHDFRRSCEWLQTRAKIPVAVAFFMPMLMAFQGAPLPFFYSHLPIFTSDTDAEFVAQMLQAANVTLGAVDVGPGEVGVSSVVQ